MTWYEKVEEKFNNFVSRELFDSSKKWFRTSILAYVSYKGEMKFANRWSAENAQKLRKL